MAAQTDIVTALQEVIAKAVPTVPAVVVGRLGADAGIAAQIAPGYNDAVYLDRSARQIMPVLLLAKHHDQKTVAGWLFDICNALQSMKEYKSADGWTWENTTTATTPGYVTREEGGLWLYSAILNLEYTLKE